MSTYEESALWNVVTEKRDALRQASLIETEAKTVYDNAKLARVNAEGEEKEWRELLMKVLAGGARVEWDERSERFIIRHKDASPDTPLPELHGSYEGRSKTPPRGAAHVGSTNQGKASTHR